jgi:hypothetical protein
VTNLPTPNYGEAWNELTGYFMEAERTGLPLDATKILNYMQELRRRAIAPETLRDIGTFDGD